MVLPGRQFKDYDVIQRARPRVADAQLAYYRRMMDEAQAEALAEKERAAANKYQISCLQALAGAPGAPRSSACSVFRKSDWTARWTV